MAQLSAVAKAMHMEQGHPVPADKYHQVMLFLYREARLLDEERYREWLNLLTNDIHYWLPVRENRWRKDRRPEPTPETSASVFNEKYEDLVHRIERFETGLVWSEDPRPRVSRTITNIEVEYTDRPDEIAVYCNISVYRNRRQDEEILYSAKRRDRLRLVEGEWKLARRHILANHHVFLDENVSMLF